MNEEVNAALAKLKDDTATKKDVMELKHFANHGNTKAALNYGICLFVGHLIDEDREEASRYFEKVYMSGRIEELNELSDFYNEVGGPAYNDLSEMIVKKAMSKFKELSLDEQLDFFMKYANKDVVDEVMEMMKSHANEFSIQSRRNSSIFSKMLK